MRPSIGNHLRQRRAVKELLDRQRVRIISQRISDGEMWSATVRVGSDYYEVRPIDLALLQDGHSPEWLGLEPIPDDQEI
ncbi:hypothetical protein RB623_21430 [Mesorhizobium sp. LHD-90]|uniref:hypothetical protein n=1 Tax=Mesorhizobium sp. LHD-90 TaxID=3071414 RepID=UPI0027E001C4|nr:hypothetical protein [Mesorhizobium sp. LHD-90]MDQ6436620.1 hypothetical protein [Mesorhizobium sp. LHD-90]